MIFQIRMKNIFIHSILLWVIIGIRFVWFDYMQDNNQFLVSSESAEMLHNATSPPSSTPSSCIITHSRTKKYFYCPPTYLLIGFPKCGSSSLFRWLSVSAGVRLYANGQRKEAHFFNQLPSIAHKTYSNYIYHFPPLTEEEYVNERNNIAIGDHTPGYIWRIPYRCRRNPSHFGCAGLDFSSNISISSTVLNVKHLLPTSTKLLVILRDPVERSYSHYWHWSAPCRMEQPRRTPQCFHNLVVEQIEELSTCEKNAGFKCACK